MASALTVVCLLGILLVVISFDNEVKANAVNPAEVEMKVQDKEGSNRGGQEQKKKGGKQEQQEQKEQQKEQEQKGQQKKEQQKQNRNILPPPLPERLY